MKKETSVLLLAGGLLSAASALMAQQQKQPNIVFIICDDLRPELGCYGQRYIHSPHIDRWAKGGVVFERAYCNIAVSGASRASLLTGYRPTRDTFEAWDCRTDKDAPHAITLPQHFQSNGYTTISNGKVFHHQNETAQQYWHDILSPVPHTPMDYHSPENLLLMEQLAQTKKGKRGFFYEHGDFPEKEYIDYQIAEKSVKDLEKLSRGGKPFLLAIGFIRPHLPFNTPQTYWDLYYESQIRIPANYHPDEQSLIPRRALTSWGELRAYSGIPAQGALDEATAKQMLHGYYASVSFVDRQVGRVLEALRRLKLDKNTTVVLIGDHGWNLGEHGTWCKHSVMNTSLHSTLIIKSPHVRKPYHSKEIVEFVDLYPTLCDAAGIPHPAGVEGESLLPLLQSSQNKSKGYAVWRWEKGFTYIENQHFYTEWSDKQGEVVERMLFDHATDPDENRNIVYRPENQGLVDYLSGQLNQKRGASF